MNICTSKYSIWLSSGHSRSFLRSCVLTGAFLWLAVRCVSRKAKLSRLVGLLFHPRNNDSSIIVKHRLITALPISVSAVRSLYTVRSVPVPRVWDTFQGAAAPEASTGGNGNGAGGGGGGTGGGGSGAGNASEPCKSHGPNPDTLEALISVNHKLGLDMAAAGILKQGEQRVGAGLCTLVVRPSWLEKLSRCVVDVACVYVA